MSDFTCPVDFIYTPPPERADSPDQRYQIRSWQAGDRQAAAHVIATVLKEYTLAWEPTGADQDAVEVEHHYQQTGGEFWVVLDLTPPTPLLVGTAGYHPLPSDPQAVELRKMYLLPAARGRGLGSFLLRQLEQAIAQRGFQAIWIETATVLAAAIQLYERHGYQIPTGHAPQTPRCDRLYHKLLSPVSQP